MRLLMERKGGRREEAFSDVESSGADTGSGRAGITDGMSANGMKAKVPLSKRIWYEGEPDGAVDNGISMTVPARSMFVVGSTCSTRVPGG